MVEFITGFITGYGLCYAFNKYKDQDTEEFAELKRKLKAIEKKKGKIKWWDLNRRK